ncbi:MAG TPA: pyridoxamine 5'-phosphate oxidase [Patescibacteria group bacterium]|nr:pyridoxamine 5'-phosphate oxidase [Patescibacteria group bacterium]
MNHETFLQFRREFMRHGLDEKDVLQDPFAQFRQWFDEAVKAGISEPNVMTIASATSDGKPSARIVLLKKLSEKGFVFYTNYESRKGQELIENPQAALLFYWGELERQIRIEGRVEKVLKEESEEYFKSRPLESQLGAWASKQSRTLKSREELEENFKNMQKRFETVVPLPDFWGGFCVIPEVVEFWQGRPNRLHDRIVFKKEDNVWITERLSP